MNNNNNAHPAGSSGTNGSLTDTLKGYVNVAMAKGQEALEQAKVLGHKAQEQLNEAVAQAKDQANAGHANNATGNSLGQTQFNSASAYPGQQQQQQAQATANNAFSDLNQFNNNANNAARNAANQAPNASNQASNAAHNAAANAGYKSSQGGL